MRINAANYVAATALPIADTRVKIRIGVHRITATADEAEAFGRELLDAAEQARKGVRQTHPLPTAEQARSPLHGD